VFERESRRRGSIEGKEKWPKKTYHKKKNSFYRDSVKGCKKERALGAGGKPARRLQGTLKKGGEEITERWEIPSTGVAKKSNNKTVNYRFPEEKVWRGEGRDNNAGKQNPATSKSNRKKGEGK